MTPRLPSGKRAPPSGQKHWGSGRGSPGVRKQVAAELPVEGLVAVECSMDRVGWEVIVAVVIDLDELWASVVRWREWSVDHRLGFDFVGYWQI